MPTVLGIHNGHHASCAVVRDGVLVAAIEQERLTRVKGDGADGLTNRLPIFECLGAAGTSLEEVDLIVSSFQSMSPGGVGLQRPLSEPGFDLFDPFDARHHVISHHYAHALSALGSSGYTQAAAIVCDLAGSTTVDGQDFVIGFAEFHARVTGMRHGRETRTECVSIYDIDDHAVVLKHREYCIPHNTPEVFVCSLGSLYDNAARAVFDKENAHGQLMALASMGETKPTVAQIEDIVEFRADMDAVHFLNDWQSRFEVSANDLDNIGLACVVQSTTEIVTLHYARLAKQLCQGSRLVAAGGVFLNIVANTVIETSGIFDSFYVPSAPHDAGASIGCAFHGWRQLAKRRGRPSTAVGPASDRLGIEYSSARIDLAIASRSHVVFAERADTKDIAARLHAGQILARCVGRAEFGPRALGGRSLLASPTHASSKSRLNKIKSRQPWRPVAPIVTTNALRLFFHGPADSPYMNRAHFIKAEHREALPALVHPDGSSRAQTLNAEDDPALFAILLAFEQLSGYPILVNTSLNGPGEPIVETPEQALDFFLSHDEVDCLILGDHLVQRIEEPCIDDLKFPHDAIVSLLDVSGLARAIVVRGAHSMEVPMTLLEFIHATQEAKLSVVPSADLRLALTRALRLELLVPNGR